MEPKKTSKKTSKTAEIPVAVVPAIENSPAVSKPVKRASAAKSKSQSTAVAKPSPSVGKDPAPKKSGHRHSKLAMPPTAQSTLTTTTKVPLAPPLKSAVSSDEIAKLAYHYWEQRNFANGCADEDWHRAEKALLSQQ